MTSRRVFLSGSAASLLAVPALPFAQQALSLAPLPPSPLTRELKRELQAAIKTMTEKGRGEGARRVATVLRLWAVHGAAQGYDAQLRDGLARGIRRHGRDTFLYSQVPHEKMREEQKAWGIPEQFLRAHPPINLPLRGKNIDLLLREGITPSLLKAADQYDTASIRMDRLFTQPVRLDNFTDCDDIKFWKEFLCDLMEIVCGAAALIPNPISADACAAAGGACGGAMIVYWALCGWWQ